ncbi:MAG: prephenate dehydratase, partial [Ignavibacteria bacterium]
MKIIAYQGEPGAYSEAASKLIFKEDIELSPSATFEIVFNKVKKGKADFGVVPVENSLYGSVFETYDLLKKYSLKIIGELNLQINHYLMSNKKYKLKDLKKIYSHPQALGQCSQFLNALKDVSILPVYDTAGAAKMIAENPVANEAAIASKRAAEVYGLKVIQGNIQNNSENYTRFLVISKKATGVSSSNTKTSICFELKSMPGALFRALSVFALRDIDLTKIESRPIAKKTFEYVFYIDMKGNLADKRIKNAINHLKEISHSLMIFGSY